MSVTVNSIISGVGSTSSTRIAGSGSASAVTGTTNETTLATFNLAGSSLGANGLLRVYCLWSMTNNANTKTPRIKIGASQIATTSGFASNASAETNSNTWAQNSQAVQKTNVSMVTPFGVSTAALTGTTVDLTTDQTVTITGQLGVSTDTLTLEAWYAEVIYAV